MVQNRKINPWTWQDALGFSQGIITLLGVTWLFLSELMIEIEADAVA